MPDIMRCFKSAAAAAFLAGAVFLAACEEGKPAAKQSKVLPNEFGKAAAQMGAAGCAALFSVLGQTVTANSAYSAKLIPDKNDADAHGLTGLVGQIYPAPHGQAEGAAAIYAAPVKSGCEGLLVRSLLMRRACAEIAAEQLPRGTQRQDDLAQTALFAMPGGGYVMMMPASAQSCVVTMIMNLRDGE